MIHRLARIGNASAVVRSLQIDTAIDAVLRRWTPRMRAKCGVEYYLDSLATLVAASEVFSSYRRVLEQLRPGAVIDIGANVGLFTALAARCSRERQLKALVIEPQTETFAKLKRNLALNALDYIEPLTGAVSAEQTGSATLYIHRAHIASSLSGNFDPLSGSDVLRGRQSVPLLDAEALWAERFGAARVDLLKVDIEGEELHFFAGHRELLRRCDNVLVEWHKWAVDGDEVESALGDCGFGVEEILESDRHVGLGWFRRQGNKAI